MSGPLRDRSAEPDSSGSVWPRVVLFLLIVAVVVVALIFVGPLTSQIYSDTYTIPNAPGGT